MTLPRLRWFFLFLGLIFLSASLPAQEDTEAPIDDPFADLFSDVLMIESPEGTPVESVSDEETDQSFDELFSSDDMFDLQEDPAVVPVPGTESPSSSTSPLDLDTFEGVRLGGRFSGSVNSDWNWNNPYTPDFRPWLPDSQSLTPDLGADLTFDARPDKDFRAFIKLRISTGAGAGAGGGAGVELTQENLLANPPPGVTWEDDGNGGIVGTDANGDPIAIPPSTFGQAQQAQVVATNPTAGTVPALNLAIYEAFTDFSWKDQLLFRFGKHTITWGVGYFWSPADVLNLTGVNAEDPTADREGPISLKTEYPFGIGNALTLYTIVNTGAQPLDVAVAPRVDLLLGNMDLGIGAYYQRTLAPRLITTTRFTLGKVDFFGEAVLSYGADRIFVRPSADQSATEAEGGPDLVLDTYEDTTTPYFSGTFGARYLKTFEEGGSFLALGQYFYNGIGYGSTIGGYPSTRVLPAAYGLLLNPGTNGLAPEDPQAEGAVTPPALGVGDVTNFGRHYAGLVLGLSEIGGSRVSLNLAVLANLTDFSAIITPGVSVGFLDAFTLSLSPRFTVGRPGAEFTNPLGLVTGDTSSWGTIGLTFGISVQGGGF
ncbi:MAG: hypothetical protein GW949_07320 [Spirochaetales bacterium]|nr:hypothetical protein [Spirochaetales bacterium]